MRIGQIVLALALVVGLFSAGARIYRRLPGPNGGMSDVAGDSAQQDLTVIFRAAISVPETRVNLYPIDFSAAQREYFTSGRSSKTLEDFLALRLKDVKPVSLQVDGTGRAVARLAKGSWWMHAVSALANGESVEWRVPLMISQHSQTVELTTENAYERTKKF